MNIGRATARVLLDLRHVLVRQFQAIQLQAGALAAPGCSCRSTAARPPPE
jgi:hypothetical protein